MCMSRYIHMLVTEGRVDRIRCPVSFACDARAEAQEVLKHTGAETFAKYERFRQMQSEPDCRQCPACARLCRPRLDEEGGVLPDMQCDSCSTEFCFYHANEHAGKRCDEYRRQVDEDERRAVQSSMHAKPCPGCGILTQKICGCNHMTCRQCKCEWCWLCGHSLTNVASHYSAHNPHACRLFENCELAPVDVRTLVCLTLVVIVFVVGFVILLFRYPVPTMVCSTACFCCHKCFCSDGGLFDEQAALPAPGRQRQRA